LASHGYTYQNPSDEELIKGICYFNEEISFFIHYVLGYGENIRYSVCGLDIMEAIIRVDKRSTYFRIFHDMEINECKKAALYAYWIVKLRPIKFIDDEQINEPGFNDQVNELFAIHFLISVISGTGKIKPWNGSEGVEITMQNSYVQDLCYSFRFGNFTIDSMIVLADSITTDSFSDFIATHKVKLPVNSDGLSIMNKPDETTAPLTKIPDGTEVQYILIDGMAGFDEKSGPWSRIKTKDGIQGWCLSDSLEKI